MQDQGLFVASSLIWEKELDITTSQKGGGLLLIEGLESLTAFKWGFRVGGGYRVYATKRGAREGLGPDY